MAFQSKSIFLPWNFKQGTVSKNDEFRRIGQLWTKNGQIWTQNMQIWTKCASKSTIFGHYELVLPELPPLAWHDEMATYSPMADFATCSSLNQDTRSEE